MAVKLSGRRSSYSLGQNADINVTPFVDIMLVLLIVMMVAVPPATLAIKVDLPPATTTEKQTKPPTFISIFQNGQIALVSPDHGTQPTDLPHLSGSIYQTLGVPNPQNETILIRADRAVRYSDFMSVVNQLQADGFYKVALIIEEGGGAAAA